MRKKRLTGCLIAALISVSAITGCNNLKTDENSEGSLLRLPESIIYDKANCRYLLSNYSTGDIVQIDSTGRQSVFVKNMKAIQGLEIYDGVVYAGAGKSIRGFDLETGKMVMNVRIRGVSNLNDVTADDSGNIYATDVFGKSIFKIRIRDKSWSVFVEGNGIDHPNGIFFDRHNQRLLVCSFRKNSPIQSISLADSGVTALTGTELSNCDGIVLDKDGRCYVTSWEKNSIYRFDSDFKDPPVVIYTNPCGVADISYDMVNDALAIPLMTCNSFEVLKIFQKP